MNVVCRNILFIFAVILLLDCNTLAICEKRWQTNKPIALNRDSEMPWGIFIRHPSEAAARMPLLQWLPSP